MNLRICLLPAIDHRVLIPEPGTKSQRRDVKAGVLKVGDFVFENGFSKPLEHVHMLAEELGTTSRSLLRWETDQSVGM